VFVLVVVMLCLLGLAFDVSLGSAEMFSIEGSGEPPPGTEPPSLASVKQPQGSSLGRVLILAYHWGQTTPIDGFANSYFLNAHHDGAEVVILDISDDSSRPLQRAEHLLDRLRATLIGFEALAGWKYYGILNRPEWLWLRHYLCNEGDHPDLDCADGYAVLSRRRENGKENLNLRHACFLLVLLQRLVDSPSPPHTAFVSGTDVLFQRDVRHVLDKDKAFMQWVQHNPNWFNASEMPAVLSVVEEGCPVFTNPNVQWLHACAGEQAGDFLNSSTRSFNADTVYGSLKATFVFEVWMVIQNFEFRHARGCLNVDQQFLTFQVYLIRSPLCTIFL
jgi:hypothetical protein